MEKGKLIPSPEKLKRIAKALDVPLLKLKGFHLESKIEQMGIREPAFISLFKDYPCLTRQDKRAIVEAYLKIKKTKTT